MGSQERLFDSLRREADTGPMFPLTNAGPFVAQLVTRRAVEGAHANGDFKKLPPKPGVRTNRMGRSGDVRST